jgi:hypothetical protein
MFNREKDHSVFRIKKKERIIIIIIAVQGVGLSVTEKIYKNE